MGNCWRTTSAPVNVVDPPVDILSALNSKEMHEAKWPFKNIVIEGGSSNGTVTLGAYKILEILNITNQLVGYAGSSVGSIFAAFASVKIPSDVVEKKFIDVDMHTFKDDSVGMVRDTARLLNEYGFYKGDVMENWVEQVLYEHTEIKGITFQQIYNIYGSDLRITRVNLSKLKTEYLSHKTTPHMRVSKAVRHSTSIPFIFRAPITSENHVITDGGLGDPYPLDVFDENKSYKNGYNAQTFGLKIMARTEERDDEILDEFNKKITSIFGYAEAVITFATLAIERAKVKFGYWERTITLDSPGRSIDDFNISPSDKMSDIRLGMQNTTTALVKFLNVGHF